MKDIKEEMGVHREWYKEAGEMTVEKLPEFINRLMNDYGHDYGTICHAIAAAAVAAAWAVERGPQGGITGFQAGAVMWEFIQNWDTSYRGQPLRLVRYEHLLYPQYDEQFTTISSETWKWLQDEAKKRLADGSPLTADRVRDRWNSIATGVVPAGFRVKDDH